MFTSKLPNQGVTVFTIMSKMAAEYNAINLSQGFPDFDVSKELIASVNKYMQAGYNQYAPMQGVPRLRAAITKMIKTTYNCTVNPENEITITSGATEGLYAGIQALINNGDEVIIFDPSYDSYAPAVKMAGGAPVHIALMPPNFNIDWQKVHEQVSSKTKMIIINSPHNPSGAIVSQDDMAELEKIAVENDIYVLSDEVYEHIVYDNGSHESILKYPSLYNRSMAVFSFGKTFHATGWKVGYVIAPHHLTDEIRKVHQFITFSVHTPTQYALADFLQQEENHSTLRSYYQQKRDFFAERISNSRFDLLPCKGSYFQLLSYKKISDKPETQMAEHLTKEYGVASIPVSVFYKNKIENQILRFCFAKTDETLEKATDILCKI